MNRDRIVATALLWIGTPWVARSAVRGAGCDCTGLLRGVYRDITGIDVPAPRWREDWALRADRQSGPATDPILSGLRMHARPVPPAQAARGHVVTFRIGAAAVAHVGILTANGVIHACERSGVIHAAPGIGRPMSTAWALLSPTCITEE